MIIDACPSCRLCSGITYFTKRRWFGRKTWLIKCCTDGCPDTGYAKARTRERAERKWNKRSRRARNRWERVRI